MTVITANSANALQVLLCQKLLELGSEASPREMRTRELLGVSFEIGNPRNRLTTLEQRKWSPALAVAELAWHIRGDTDVEALAFYTPRWREFADIDGKVRGSCYGARIFDPLRLGGSQWVNVRRLLIEDRFSRRAVLNFRVEEDVSRNTNDVSCTNTLQFMVRDNQLHAFANMRSNDAIWGVPYDMFLFSCLQELMAVELGVELGRYHHYASSMHIYERHFDLATRIANSDQPTELGAMAAMKDFFEVQGLAKEESLMRLTGKRSKMLLDEFGEQCMTLLGLHKNLSFAA